MGDFILVLFLGWEEGFMSVSDMAFPLILSCNNLQQDKREGSNTQTNCSCPNSYTRYRAHTTTSCGPDYFFVFFLSLFLVS